MKIAWLVTAVILAVGSYGLSARGAEAVPLTNNPAEMAAAASVVPAPQWRVGSTWEYSDGYGMRVSAVRDGVTTFERLDAKDQWFSMHGFLRQNAASSTAARQTIYRTVSPEAGTALRALEPVTFQREYLSNGKLIVHASSWSVEGRERITVPAGTFDCWIMVWRERSLKSNWTGFERWWYSPEAQQYVRLEYRYGAMETASRVLMRYSLADAAAAEARPAPAPAGVEPSVESIKPVPVNAIELAPVIVLPTPPAPAGKPELPLTSRNNGPEARATVTLREIPLQFTRLAPLYVPPLSEVTIAAEAEASLWVLPTTSTAVMALTALPVSEAGGETPARRDAEIRTASLEPLAISPILEVASETPARAQAEPGTPWPPDRIGDLRDPLIVYDDLDSYPQVPTKTYAPQPVPMEPIVAPSILEAEIAASALALADLPMVWPDDRIENYRKTLAVYLDPEPFMSTPPRIASEPATGRASPRDFLTRVFHGVEWIFDKFRAISETLYHVAQNPRPPASLVR